MAILFPLTASVDARLHDGTVRITNSIKSGCPAGVRMLQSFFLQQLRAEPSAGTIARYGS